MNNDGTQEERITPENIVYASGISPDERFVAVRRPLKREDKWWEMEALPVSGGPSVPLCSGWCDLDWSRDGKLMYFYWQSFSGDSRTYVVPVLRGSDFPKLPKSGFQSEQELRKVALQVFEGNASPGPDGSRYTYSKENSHWNLYRIPVQ
jgi:hypothetical protein